MSKKIPAGEAFASLGLTDSSVYTKAMSLAIKQHWSDLPVDKPVADLRAELAALEAAGPTPPPDLVGDPRFTTVEEVEKEFARLKRNAAVNHWRARNQIRAALDARDLKFAALRAKRGSKVAPPKAGAVSGDVARVAS